ncbi:KedN5 family methylcobalamin-dependent radical SAM C-methyltransferase [Actinomadura terrae]|uniref:KedN5 family methylcobalamin-dependent radical SAM C-methyltransferase n=1 Tax=Actinomadura terrae TaxID=604353 RepID=UPI001FA816FA|nr:KedN5 family methylcobalamin-dependent radical SAM C-methyltransferase [Actinomadura terrae]
MKIVQQGVWHMSKESMPLAAGYLAATIKADPVLRSNCDVAIENFSGSSSPLEMAVRLLREQPPDVVGFSVLGWNVRQFAMVAEAIKQANPRSLIVFGGNHVANQGERVFRLYEAVDVVVNGEGEIPFRELVHAVLEGRGWEDIDGISFRGGEGEVVTTAVRQRIDDLDEIPSPILTGTIPLLNDDGEFRYDVALLETNRGCPYHCAFCYWGGAVGQKVRAFSRQRLRMELECLAEAGAETIVLCDANFGMLPADREFVDDLIEVKERFGYPHALETSWAKNKNATFYDIVRRMRDAGLQSSFTLALQTLDDQTLTAMNRRNMKINQWRDLADWLAAEGLDSYAELIWGAPGETPESFLRGYDELAQYVSRIAAYPLLLLPNTEYTDHRERYGFVTVRGERDDFEYVLANKDVSLEENLRMQRFLFWARLLAENLVLRDTWAILREVGDLSQSAAILSLADYIEAQDTPGARLLKAAAESSTADPDSLAPALEFCFTEGGFDEMVQGWFAQRLATAVPAEWRKAVGEVLQFDLDSRPLPQPEKRGFSRAELVVVNGVRQWRVKREYGYDVAAIVRNARHADEFKRAPRPRPVAMTLWFRHGFAELARSTNHEETTHYVARAERTSGLAVG